MKHRIINHIALFAMLLLTACQSDDTTGQGGGIQPDGKVRVRLNVGVAGSQTANSRTRATWNDGQATDYEMMNIWTVVIVNDADDQVVEIQSCRPSSPYAEIDDLTTLPEGTYRFYSFANISAPRLETLLGLPSGSVPVIPTDTKDVISSIKAENYTPPTGTTGGMGTIGGDNSNNPARNIKAAINGNNFDPAANNNYGEVGIPMSNVQRIEITGDTSIDLIVIRMLAKIEVDVYNDGETKATINSISLTDVTPNIDNNLMLLPKLTSGANTMNFEHEDIRPNLGTTSKGNITYSFTTDNVVEATGHKSTGTGQTPVKFIFYVNESVAPDNGSGLFYLSLGIKTGTGEDVVYTHALIDNRNIEGKTGSWNYIARNDYRIIPVVLTDWQFRIEPIALAPIAGYPAMTLSSDGLKATFSTGGLIALQPFVKKRTEDTWRDFGDPEVEFVSVTMSDNSFFVTPFAYDPVTGWIIGDMDYVTGTHRTAVTVTVKLGPSGSQFTYSFTCDVILQA